jgi:hypothetical protein
LKLGLSLKNLKLCYGAWSQVLILSLVLMSNSDTKNVVKRGSAMKWFKDSLSLAKNSAIVVALFTMVISPVAQGAAAKTSAKAKVKAIGEELNYNVNAKTVQEYLKFTGLNAGKKPVTVGEFYSKMRPYYPKTLQRQMDRWARENRSEIMPEFEATTFKDSDGKDHVRLLISKDGQTVTATFNPESSAKFVKVNNVYLTKTDMMYHDQVISKLVYGDAAFRKEIDKAPVGKTPRGSVALSYEEFKRFTPRQRAEYLVKLRYVTEGAERVMKNFYGEQALNEFKKDFFVQMFLGQNAQAAGPAQGNCIVSGYLSMYGENYSCGGSEKGKKDLQEKIKRYGGSNCSSGTTPCNPLVYGFKTQGPPGQAFCVSNANVNGSIRNATSAFCPMQAPLRKNSKFEAEDKKRIIESWMAAKGQKIDLLFDKDGKISEDQFKLVSGYLTELNDYINQATVACQTVPLSATVQVREEQASACTALATRKMELQTYPDLAGGPVGDDNCSVEKPGSKKQGNSCVCSVPGTVEGPIKEGGVEKPGCIAPVGVLKEEKQECNKDEKRDEKTGECVALCGHWCKYGKWYIGAGIAGGIIGLIALLSKDGKDKDKDDPVDRCPAPPLACQPPIVGPPPVVPPVVQPPPVVTTSPTPIVIPTPVPTPFQESTTEVPTSTSGGVR